MDGMMDGMMTGWREMMEGGSRETEELRDRTVTTVAVGGGEQVRLL
jgi:hypothetical protein